MNSTHTYIRLGKCYIKKVCNIMNGFNKEIYVG